MKMPADYIREEIEFAGAIPFARFMELALYCPETGYYEQNQDNVGRAGDFITSVSTGELFGQLLAYQFGGWLADLKQNQLRPVQIVEAGAHDGNLAADILGWLKQSRSTLFAELEYVIIEPSATRRQWQRERLKNFQNVRWISSLVGQDSVAPKPDFTGIIFSNELLDAFPVHRLGWDAKEKKWFEHGVTLAGENFAWTRLPTPSSIPHLPSSLLNILPDGYSIEVSPAAENWWLGAARSLRRGKLLAIDYGLTADEQIAPARTNGTLRAYHRHQVSDDLLANPGAQDLTAHVNFSAVQKCGEQAGLCTETFCTQPQFLTRILGDAVKKFEFAQLDAKQIRQFHTLTHPNHLGRAFRVLVQSR